MIPGQVLSDYMKQQESDMKQQESETITLEVPVYIYKSLLPQLKGKTLYIDNIGKTPELQVNPNEILHNMLDHIHDGNREELVGELILMLGWLHKGGIMPNISKDTITNTTIWIIINDN